MRPRPIVVDERKLYWYVSGEGINIKCPQGCRHHFPWDGSVLPSDVNWLIRNKLPFLDHKSVDYHKLHKD